MVDFCVTSPSHPHHSPSSAEVSQRLETALKLLGLGAAGERGEVDEPAWNVRHPHPYQPPSERHRHLAGLVHSNALIHPLPLHFTTLVKRAFVSRDGVGGVGGCHWDCSTRQTTIRWRSIHAGKKNTLHFRPFCRVEALFLLLLDLSAAYNLSSRDILREVPVLLSLAKDHFSPTTAADMPSPQARVDEFIKSEAYNPRVAILTDVGNDLLEPTNDAAWLRCMETLGDARVGYGIACVQTRHFPDLAANIHRRMLCTLASNRTFQGIVVAMGSESQDASASKQVGDALEVFFEALGRSRPEAEGIWSEDLFLPLVSALVESSARKRSRPNPVANKPSGRKIKTSTFISVSCPTLSDRS
ncbi:hypothetical protein C8R43DRAFT_115197 [Mycena crocata]|nr:hypothetical protein C8R43DRAFT_115197 [Mycena crocata]